MLQRNPKVVNFILPILAALTLVLHADAVFAEPYVGISAGGMFDSKIRNITGNENINYPDPAQSIYPGTGGNGSTALYPDTHYTPLDLKSSFIGGVRAGYFFKKLPSFGLELEGSYSTPSFLEQNVTIRNPGFNDPVNGLPLGQTHLTEKQLSATSRLGLFALNGIYRYQGFHKIVPYVGGGPALFIFRTTGTGHSGITLDPPAIADPVGVNGPRIQETSVDFGLNLKAGMEYKLTDLWRLALEYHYNWCPINISRFRSASDVSGNFHAQSVSLVLTHHF